ncbi:MAG: globin domain-containing protein [Acetobacteraceae bacterium]|jgi:nitric oxide dioxygenase|nr:globin domain-containing protein [Acetobacteraceae bacterium]
MTLTQDEIELLRASFRQLAQAPEQAASLFYGRLFERTPAARAMFPADMDAQGLKMMSTLGLVVSQLHDLAAMTPVVGALARRHVGYGVRPEHYALLAEPLDYMLRQGLGEKCTEAVADAWAKALAGLAAAMIAAAYPPEPAAA